MCESHLAVAVCCLLFACCQCVHAAGLPAVALERTLHQHQVFFFNLVLMCVCGYINIQTCASIYMYTYIHTLMHVCVCVCMHVHMSRSLHSPTLSSQCVCVCTYAQTLSHHGRAYVCIYMHVYIHTYNHACMCMCLHACTHEQVTRQSYTLAPSVCVCTHKYTYVQTLHHH